MGLKERSDKRDAIALAASLTGFQVDFHDSVNGDDMSDKARPPVCMTSLRPLLIANKSLIGNEFERRGVGMLARSLGHNP